MSHVTSGAQSRAVRRRLAKHLLPLAIASSVGCEALSPQSDGLRWQQLSAGYWRTCGIEAGTGEAYCWGGPEGRRAASSLESSEPEIPLTAVPLAMPGDVQVANISVGESPICALDVTGEAFCAGRNTNGQVGDGTTVDRRGFTAVAGGHRWRSLATSSSHVCGVRLDLAAYCWGNGFRGKLGNGLQLGNSLVPTAVATQTRFTALAAGSGHTCGLDISGSAWCWGVNDAGQLGDGYPPAPGRMSEVPTRVHGDREFIEIYAGGSHSCGIDAQRRAFCWGHNGFNQLGNGTVDTTSLSIPTAMTGDFRWKQFVLGQLHGCGVATDDDLYCWGNNLLGQFGDGTTTSSVLPRRVRSARGYRSVIAGARHMCAVSTDGTAQCWGRGEQGQLGNGVFQNRPVPSAVAGAAR